MNADESQPGSAPSRMQLVVQFLVGTLFLVATAAIVAGKSGLPFAYCAAGVLGGAAATMATGLAWLLRAAAGREGGSRQFSLTFLLLATTFAAAYFALVGWLARLVSPGAPITELLGPIVTVSIVLLLLGLPVLLIMAESVIVLAQWLSRRRLVQRFVFGRER